MLVRCLFILFFFSSRRRHTRSLCDWSSDVCSSDLGECEYERLRWRGKFRAETIGLKLRAVSQIAAADAGGKAEKVLDQRRSEERRVGKECRNRRAPEHEKKKKT